MRKLVTFILMFSIAVSALGLSGETSCLDEVSVTIYQEHANEDAKDCCDDAGLTCNLCMRCHVTYSLTPIRFDHFATLSTLKSEDLQNLYLDYNSAPPTEPPKLHLPKFSKL